VRLIIILISVATLASGCGSSISAGGRTSVVAAFYPHAYAAEQVGGGAVSVTNLTPPGVEPHDVELSPSDVARVVSADRVFFLGGFQPEVDRAARSASGEAVDLLPADARPGDPHVWLDPLRYAEIVGRIGRELGRPARAARLEARLHLLDRDYRRGLARCARRELLTSHAAFGYLAARYGLRQVALTGTSPEAEPSPQDLRRIVDTARAHRATTIFSETLVSPRLAETVAREAGARTAVLDPIEGLTPAEAQRGDDYFTIMRRNLATLREALGCR
jgi:zinc transport system substrate-binding protein